jgi:hypothetical protein
MLGRKACHSKCQEIALADRSVKRIQRCSRPNWMQANGAVFYDSSAGLKKRYSITRLFSFSGRRAWVPKV